MSTWSILPEGYLSTDTVEFERICVISLASRTDRRDSMTLAAAVSGLRFEYVEGVDHVVNKTPPPGGIEAALNAGSLNGWRAYMFVL
jgi:hypothetical protein